ncbi:MAG: hypothetical protein FJ319_10985 [SAR202 cluster bacterium]|nr:hypothetical protein [SAR202 cluster bacterium]
MTVNGGEPTSGSVLLNSDGVYSISYSATDLAGNTVSHTASVKIDRVGPSVTMSVTPPVNSRGWHTAPVTVSASGADAGSGFTVCDAPVLLDQDGVNYSVSLSCTDVAGNVAFAQVTGIDIDTTFPVTSVTLAGPAGENGWFTGAVTVTLSAADPTSGILTTDYRIVGSVSQPYTGPFTVSAQGANVVEFFSRNGAGMLEAAKAVSVNIDSVAPNVIALLQPGVNVGGETWYASPPSVTLAATDAASGVPVDGVSFRINGGAAATYPGSLSITSDGVNTLEFWARDRAGNEHRPAPIAVRVDTLPPVTNAFVISGTQGQPGWYRSQVLLALNATDAGTGVAPGATMFRVNGSPPQQ